MDFIFWHFWGFWIFLSFLHTFQIHYPAIQRAVMAYSDCSCYPYSGVVGNPNIVSGSAADSSPPSASLCVPYRSERRSRYSAFVPNTSTFTQGIVDAFVHEALKGVSESRGVLFEATVTFGARRVTVESSTAQMIGMSVVLDHVSGGASSLQSIDSAARAVYDALFAQVKAASQPVYSVESFPVPPAI
jgi:hypothetical protein